MMLPGDLGQIGGQFGDVFGGLDPLAIRSAGGSGRRRGCIHMSWPPRILKTPPRTQYIITGILVRNLLPIVVEDGCLPQKNHPSFRPPGPSQFDRGRRVTHVPGESDGRFRHHLHEKLLPTPWYSMKVVVVESPSKAKTINKYLGPGYEVLASFGHVRDLPPKDGSVDPEQDFRMLWEVDDKSAKRLNDIARAVKGAEKLILATDPDREGEAISWHVLEVLKEKNALKSQQVERVVFNAITKQAVAEALKNRRQIDSALVDAYLARRALDYLVGFTLSPVLWPKLPGARSPRRVQSRALRLVGGRDPEIENFAPREYWALVST